MYAGCFKKSPMRQKRKIDTPTVKTVGFLLPPPQRRLRRYATGVLHGVHKLDYTVPVCPTVQFYMFMLRAFVVLC